MRRLSFPMMVMPPPFIVPVLMVTNSRIWFPSPMSRRVGSPLYEVSCGGVPTEANGKRWLPAPNSVWPVTTQWLSMTVPGPMRTCSLMTRDGPTTTSSASSALGWTLADGSIFGIPNAPLSRSETVRAIAPSNTARALSTLVTCSVLCARLGDRSGQADIRGVAGLVAENAGGDAAAGEEEVAEHVQDFVADAFVREPRRRRKGGRPRRG